MCLVEVKLFKDSAYLLTCHLTRFVATWQVFLPLGIPDEYTPVALTSGNTRRERKADFFCGVVVRYQKAEVRSDFLPQLSGWAVSWQGKSGEKVASRLQGGKAILPQN